MIELETRVKIPFLWGKAVFKKSNWSQINLIVGPNGSGKTLLAENLAKQFEAAGYSVKFLRADRNYIDQISILKKNEKIRAKIEKVLSSMFGKAITFIEDIDGTMIPIVENKAWNVEYMLDDAECHGLREIISLLVNLYDSAADDCLFIDEPELHLHPQFQTFFMNEIRKEVSHGQRRMFFLISHSPFYIDLRTPEELTGVIVCHVNKAPTSIEELSEEDDALFRRFLPHGVQDPDVPVRDEVRKSLGRQDLKVAVRLFFLAGGLGRRLGIGKAHRAVEPLFVPGAFLDGPCNSARAFPVPGLLRNIEVGLVQRNIFRCRSVGVPDVMERGGDRAVLVEIRMPVDAVRAERVGVLDVHARTHAVFARLVAAGRNDPPLVRQGADDERLSHQGGIITGLDRRIKGVHIHMYDDPVHVLPQIPLLQPHGTMRGISPLLYHLSGRQATEAPHGEAPEVVGPIRFLTCFLHQFHGEEKQVFFV